MRPLYIYLYAFFSIIFIIIFCSADGDLILIFSFSQITKEIKCVFFSPLFFFPLLLVCVCVWMKDQRLESRLSPCAVAERDNQKSGIISFVDFGTIENDVYAWARAKHSSVCRRSSARYNNNSFPIFNLVVGDVGFTRAHTHSSNSKTRELYIIGHISKTIWFDLIWSILSILIIDATFHSILFLSRPLRFDG